MQVYFPDGRMNIQPEFLSRGEDMRIYPIEGELVVDSWNKRTKVWSGIYKLDFSPCTLGDNSLFVEIFLFHHTVKRHGKHMHAPIGFLPAPVRIDCNAHPLIDDLLESLHAVLFDKALKTVIPIGRIVIPDPVHQEFVVF
jgi:hypothetical protein